MKPRDSAMASGALRLGTLLLTALLTALLSGRASFGQTQGQEHGSGAESLNLDKADGTKLTLEDCIHSAVRSATLVMRQKNSTEVSGAALIQAYMQFLPNLTAQANSTFYSGNQYFASALPTLVSNNGISGGYALSADLNIFNGFADAAGLKSAKLKKDASNLSLVRAKQTIALNVAQSFMNVMLDNRLVQIAKKNFQESEAREELLVEQTRVGSKSMADLFRQKAQTSSDEARYLSSENKRRTDQIYLLQQLRLDVTQNYHFVDLDMPADNVDVRYSNENELIQAGLDIRADLRASLDFAEATRSDVTRARSTYLPHLDLQAGLAAGGAYLYSQTVAGQNVVPNSQSPLSTQWGSQTEYTLGIVLTWQIWDRYVTQLNVTQAQANQSNAEIDAQDSRNQVLADIRLAYSGYQTAASQLRASKQGLTAAQKAYEVIEGRYEFGSANFIDLITSQASLLEAESTRAQAQVNFLLQSKSVDFATGKIQTD